MTNQTFQNGAAAIHYQTKGKGLPIVFVHAGVADSRQWNNEFHSFAERFQVIRYDQRGFGRTNPVNEAFSHLADLETLIDHLIPNQTVILVGCSMGGGHCIDYTLEHPDKVRGLVLVGSGPNGLELDLPAPEKFKLVGKAEKSGDMNLVCELKTQLWFDGDRPMDAVNQEMRNLAFEMIRQIWLHDKKKMGTRKPNLRSSAADRLAEINIPVLSVVGIHDIPYIHAANLYMDENIKNFTKVLIEDSAHLTNMDQPAEFTSVLSTYFKDLEAST